MATIKHIFKGESLTILFAFPAEYDMARIQSHGIWIGGTEFTGVIIGQGIELKLTSLQTDLMSGNQRVSLWIDDTILGVRKPYVGDLSVSNTNALPDNESTSEVYDVIVNVDISVTSIEAGDLMFNYVKGDPFVYADLTPEQKAELKGEKGDPFEFSDFTPEQIALLQQPASDAAGSIALLEGEIEGEEALRVTAETNRNNAEGLRLSAETTRGENEADRIKAEGLRVGAETGRQTAEGLRAQAELNRQTNTSTAISNAEQATDDANDAAILANEKAGLAETATTQANAARDGANSAAQSATNLVNSYATDLAQKANHGYGTNPQKTLKQVEDMTSNLLYEYIHSGNKEVRITSIDYATNTFTSPNHGLVNGDRLVINGSRIVKFPQHIPFSQHIPNPGADNVIGYFVKNATTNDFQISLTSNGNAVALVNKATVDNSTWWFEIPKIGLTITGITTKAIKIEVAGNFKPPAYLVDTSAAYRTDRLDYPYGVFYSINFLLKALYEVNIRHINGTIVYDVQWMGYRISGDATYSLDNMPKTIVTSLSSVTTYSEQILNWMAFTNGTTLRVYKL